MIGVFLSNVSNTVLFLYLYLGLSESELELALEQLALTHVAGYQYIEQYPGGVEMFKKDFKVHYSYHVSFLCSMVKILYFSY